MDNVNQREQAGKRGTRVLPCLCAHAYQDEAYGVGNRVHNYSPKRDLSKKDPPYHCTVCGRWRHA